MTTIRPALAAAARAALAARTEALFRAARRPDGGDPYDPWPVLADPGATAELCGFWAGEYARLGVTLVVGVGADGQILAYETARQLGARMLVGSSAPGGDRAEAERALVVAGVIDGGHDLPATIEAVEQLGGEILGCHALVDRSGEERSTVASPSSGRVYPLRSLWRVATS